MPGIESQIYHVPSIRSCRQRKLDRLKSECTLGCSQRSVNLCGPHRQALFDEGQGSWTARVKWGTSERRVQPRTFYSQPLSTGAGVTLDLWIAWLCVRGWFWTAQKSTVTSFVTVGPSGNSMTSLPLVPRAEGPWSPQGVSLSIRGASVATAIPEAMSLIVEQDWFLSMVLSTFTMPERRLIL